MAKRPHPGRTKTRLCPPLTYGEAAQLSHCFLRDAVSKVRAIPQVTPFLAIWPPDETEFFQELAPDFEIITQSGQSLSQRLDHVMTRGSETGFQQVVALNGDSPTLPAEYLSMAFRLLERATVDIVLGPADDGGYFLIGWKHPNHRLIRDVVMSTQDVLRDTLWIAAQENLSVALTPHWYDVDGPEELARLRAELANSAEGVQYTRSFFDELEREKTGQLGGQRNPR
jgi:rSAM/selenodomain-associated transferase 1